MSTGPTSFHRSFHKSPLLLGLALTVTVVALTGAPSSVAVESSTHFAARSFERLKALEGEWRGTNSSGDTVSLTYELVSGGTAVLERERIADHPEMLTLYHLDGERLILTHYCVGNQPRMAAKPNGETDDRIEFELVDVTGLEHPGEGHMHRATFELAEEGRLRSAWTWREEGEDAFTVVVDAERVSDRRDRTAADR